AADGQLQRAVEDDDQGIERSGVLAQALPLVEREEREAASGVLCQDPARNALVGRRDEIRKAQRLGGGNRGCGHVSSREMSLRSRAYEPRTSAKAGSEVSTDRAYPQIGTSRTPVSRAKSAAAWTSTRPMPLPRSRGATST